LHSTLPNPSTRGAVAVAKIAHNKRARGFDVDIITILYFQIILGGFRNI